LKICGCLSIRSLRSNRYLFALGVVLIAILFPTLATAANYTVTDAADSAADPGDVNTLRWALNQALATNESDTIIISTGLIAVSRELPHISGSYPIEITCAAGAGISGSGLSGAFAVDGLTIESSDNKIHNCTIFDFPGNGMNLTFNATNNEIGPDNSIIQNSIMGINIRNSTAHDNYIYGNTIGESGAQRNFKSGISITEGSNNNVIIGNIIQYNGVDGISLTEYSNNNCMANNQIVNQKHVGIYITSGSSNNRVEQTCTLGAGHEGLATYATGSNSISYNFLGGIQIQELDTSNNTVRNAEILGNRLFGISLVEGTHDNLIGVDDGHVCNTDYGNNIDSTVGIGVEFVSGAEYNYVGCNTISSSKLENVSVNTGSNHNVVGPENSISETGTCVLVTDVDTDLNEIGPSNTMSECGNGVYLRSDADENSIFENTINGCLACNNGIINESNSNYTLISDNIIDSLNALGIGVIDSNNCDILGNEITSVGSGVVIESSDQINIITNQVDHAREVGLRFEYASDVIVDDNQVTNSGEEDTTWWYYGSGYYYPQNAAVEILANSTNIPLTRNTITHSDSNGIFLDETVTAIEIGDGTAANANSIRYNYGVGVHLITTPNNVRYNTISNNGLDGVALLTIDGGLGTTEISNNTISQNRSGIRCIASDPDILNNNINNNAIHGIMVEVDYGFTASPSSTGDDIYSNPRIVGGSLSNNGQWGAILLDSGIANTADILDGSAGITYAGNGEGAISQAWYGLSFIENHRGTPIIAGEVSILEGNSTIVSNSDGFAPAYTDHYAGLPMSWYPSWYFSEDELTEDGNNLLIKYNDARTWEIVHQYYIQNNGVVVDNMVHVDTTTHSHKVRLEHQLEECCYYSWDGDTGNDFDDCRYENDSEKLSDANANGHFQVSKLRTTTKSSVKIGVYDPEEEKIVSAPTVFAPDIDDPDTTPNQIYLCVTDPDQTVSASPLQLDVTVTTTNEGDSEIFTLNRVSAPGYPGWEGCPTNAYAYGPITLRIATGTSPTDILYAGNPDQLVVNYLDPEDFCGAECCRDRETDNAQATADIYTSCEIRTYNAAYEESNLFYVDETVLFELEAWEENDPSIIDSLSERFSIYIEGGGDQLLAGQTCTDRPGDFTLYESGVDTAIFEQQFGVEDANANSADCTIQGTRGSEIVLRYEGVDPLYKCVHRINIAAMAPTACEIEFQNGLGQSVSGFNINSIIHVQVTDGDQNFRPVEVETIQAQNITVTNISSSPQDFNNLGLTETDVDAGIFTGLISSSNDSVYITGNDGVLYADDKHRIRVRYDDPRTPDFCVAEALISNLPTDAELYFIHDDDEGLPILDGNDTPVNPWAFQVGSDRICIEVYDPDQNLSIEDAETIGAAQVVFQNTNVMNGDLENLELVETEPNSAQFSGCISTQQLPGPMPDNGQVEAWMGDSIEITYTDPDDPTDVRQVIAHVIDNTTHPCEIEFTNYIGQQTDQFLVGQVIFFSLDDPDENYQTDRRDVIPDWMITITNTSILDVNNDPVDWENVFGAETANNSGIFTGSLRNLSDPVYNAPGDNVLYVVQGNEIDITFVAPNNSDTCSAQATIVDATDGQIYFTDSAGNMIVDDFGLPEDEWTFRIEDEQICIEVFDPDNNLDNQVIETLSADAIGIRNVIDGGGGDFENLILTETGFATGLFGSCISTQKNVSPNFGDGVIQASPGDLLLITYTDPDDLSDSSAITAHLIDNDTFPCDIEFVDSRGQPTTEYLVNQTTFIRLAEPDRNLDPLVHEVVPAANIVIENLTQAGETDHIIAVEGAVDSSSFDGNIVLSADSVDLGSDDGILYALDGDQLEVTYTDDRPDYLDSCRDTVYVVDRTDGELYFIDETGNIIVNEDGVPETQWSFRLENDSICFEVFDPDVNDLPGVAETLPTTSLMLHNVDNNDYEYIALTETYINSSQFSGCIDTADSVDPYSADGIIQGSAGDTILITYRDPNDSADSSYITAYLTENITHDCRIYFTDAIGNFSDSFVVGQSVGFLLTDADRDVRPFAQDVIPSSDIIILNQTYEDNNSVAESNHIFGTEKDDYPGYFEGILLTSDDESAIGLDDNNLYAIEGDEIVIQYTDYSLINPDYCEGRAAFVESSTAELYFIDYNDEIIRNPSGDPATEWYFRIVDDQICIEVFDPDRNNDSTTAEQLPPSSMVLRNANTGDSEQIVLTERDSSSGRFNACIDTAQTPTATPNDGIAQAMINDRIFLTYTDPDDSSDTVDIVAVIIDNPITACQISFIDARGEQTSVFVSNQTIAFSLSEGDHNLRPDLREVIDDDFIEILNMTHTFETDRASAAETAVDSGVFEGSRFASDHPSALGVDDGLLWASDDSQILIRYTDPSPVNPDLCEDTATIVDAYNSDTRFTDSDGQQKAEFLIDEELICIEIMDPDQNLHRDTPDVIPSTAIFVQNLTNGDVEHFSMSETDNASGLFRVCIVSENSDEITEEDDILQAQAGDEITAVYSDPDDSDDSSEALAVIISTLNSDCAFLDVIGGEEISYITQDSNIFVEIVDPDEDVDFATKESIQVTLSCPKTNDEETLLLVETGIHSGAFQGSMVAGLSVAPEDIADQVTLIPAVPGDGQLACEINFDIILSYSDPNNEEDESICDAPFVYSNQDSVTYITDENYQPVDVIEFGQPIFVETIELDKNRERYQVETVLTNVFVDLDGNNMHSIDEELEHLPLDESGTCSGIFHGQIDMAESFPSGRKGLRLVAASHSGDSIVNVRLGDRIIAEYQDPADLADRSSASALILGSPLIVRKTANKEEVVIGDIITYVVEVENTDLISYNNVSVVDQFPYKFSYLPESAYVVDDIENPTEAVKLPEPEWIGAGRMRFNLGSVPGEPSGRNVRRILYQLTPSSGTPPGRYSNEAWAEVQEYAHSNVASFEVTVTLDPIFDLSTIIGKVFEDANSNGVHDNSEKGIPDVKVALETGLYAITDKYGRYHFEGVMPYSHVVKVDVNTLPPGAIFTTEHARVIDLTAGLMGKVNFGIQTPYDVEIHELERTQAFLVAPFTIPQRIRIKGNATRGEVLINGEPLALLRVDIELRDLWEDRTVIYNGGSLRRPVVFTSTYNGLGDNKRWKFNISRTTTDNEGNLLPAQLIYSTQGEGKPPYELTWDGRNEARKLVIKPETDYLFWLEMWDDRTGSHARSSRRTLITRVRRPQVSRGGVEQIEFARASISIEMILKLRDIASYLRDEIDRRITIEGHTDDIGRDEYNLMLSQRRANEVKKYLVLVENIDEGRISAIGYGESRPKFSNDNAEHRAANRRVEIKVEGSDAAFDLTYTNLEINIASGKPMADATSAPSPATSPSGVTEPVALPPRQLVTTNDRVPVDIGGNFYFELEPGTKFVDLSLVDQTGRVSDIHGELPTLTIYPPNLPQIIPITVESFILRGSTEPENTVTINGSPVQLSVDGSFAAEIPLAAQVIYTVKATNAGGFTVQEKRGIRLIGSRRDKSKLEIKKGVPLTVYWPPEEEVVRTNNLTIFGFTATDAVVEINGEECDIDDQGNFRVVLTLEDGLNEVVVTAKTPAGDRARLSRDLLVDSNVFFMVALADIEGHSLDIEGQEIGGQPLQDVFMENSGHEYYQDHYYVEGRVAFYLKGKVLGRYLITAALDTEKDDANQMLEGLDDVNTTRLFRELDPDAYYPVYGDESTVVDDTDSLGKFYVLVEWDESSFKWGNYQTGLTGSEFAQYNRTLYGGRLGYRSVSETRFGDPDTQLILFLADPITRAERDELRVITTKSNYQFRQQRVIEGSESVTLEIRDEISNLVIGRIPLARGKDYSVSYFFGHIILTRPVESYIATDSITSANLTSGRQTWLVIEYEYEADDNVNLYDYSRGGRFTQQFTDYVRLGGSYIDEKSDYASGYQLMESDLRLQIFENTILYGEVAQSQSASLSIFRSYDGGFNYSRASTDPLDYDDDYHKAYKFEFATDLEPLQISGYWRRINQGFASGGIAASDDSVQLGGEVAADITDSTRVALLYDQYKLAPAQYDEHLKKTVTAQVVQRVDMFIPWDFTFEISYQEEDNDNLDGMPNGVSDPVALGPSAKRSLGAVRADAHITDNLTVYARHQQTFAAELEGESDDDYNQETLGADWQITEDTMLGLEGTRGWARGDAGRVLLNHQLDESTSIYSGYNYTDDHYNDRRTGAAVAGGSYSVADRMRVWSEEQYAHGDQLAGPTTLNGADYSPLDRLTVGGFIELAQLEEEESSYDRTGFSVYAGWLHKYHLELTTKYEFRIDAGDEPDSMGIKRDFRTREILTTNTAKWIIARDYTLFSKYAWNRVRTRHFDELLNKHVRDTEAYFNIWTLGFAYRPTEFDWLNIISKLSQLRRMRPLQLDPTRTEQRKDVASMEFIFDLHHYVSLGEKVAGKDTYEHVTPLPWSKTRTVLWVNRLMFHVTSTWDLVGEYRVLQQLVPANKLDGYLVEVNRLVADHVRLGAGYNFSRFSDNEFADNDYDAYGFLMRLQAVY
jgi:uncharacterized repeat protein (TIGR01451 family)